MATIQNNAKFPASNNNTSSSNNTAPKAHDLISKVLKDTLAQNNNYANGSNTKTIINNKEISLSSTLQYSLIKEIVKIALLYSNNVDKKTDGYKNRLEEQINTKKGLTANDAASVKVDAEIQDLLNKISDLERNRNTIFDYTKKMMELVFKLIDKIIERSNLK